MKFVTRGLVFCSILIGVLLCGCSERENLLSLDKLELPSMRKYLLYSFDLPCGKYRTLNVNGLILDVDTTDYHYNDAILVLRFFNVKGESCGFGGLSPTTVFREKAGFVYLAGGQGEAKSFARRVPIPEGATRMELGLSRFNNDRRIELHDFKCAVFSSDLVDFIVDRVMTWRNFGLLLLFGVVLFFVCMRGRASPILCRIYDKVKAVLSRADLSWFCLLFVATFFFFVGIRMAVCGCDMRTHIRLAESISIEDLLCPIEFWKQQFYPLWHLAVKLVKVVFHFEDSVLAAGVVNGCCYNACLIGIYVFLKRTFRTVDSCALIFMAATVCTVGCMLGPYVDFRYLCENTPNSWHNPTNMMVRALALPCVLLTTRLLDKSSSSGSISRIQWRWAMVLGLLLVLSELAKPSFIQVYLPTLFLFLGGWWLVNRKKSVAAVLPISLALLMPCLILLMQYVLVFGSRGDGGIGFGFMKVIGQYEHSGINMLYAVAFPVAALIASILRRKIYAEDIFCWLMLLVGLAMRLFLFERGERMAHGNLSWGYALSLYLVWVASIRQYVDIAVSQNSARMRWAFWGLSVIMFLHVLTGFYKMYEMMCLGSRI